MELLKQEKTPKSTVTITVKVTKEEFKGATDKAFAKNSKNVNIPGFRKGKAPRNIIEKMYGENVFFEDAINICYPQALEYGIKEAGITAIGPADVDLDESTEEGITFKFAVPVAPEVTLSAYKGLEVEKEEVKKPTAAQIKAELEAMASKLARVESVDRKIKKGDTVNFDFEGFVDGVPFPGGKAEGFDLEIGSGQFIPGFEDAMVGAKALEEIDVNVTFPEEYHAADLAGKPAVFKCKINNVKETITPKIDDEFAKDASEFDSLDELKKDISEKLVKSAEENSVRMFEQNCLEVLTGNLEGEIPDVLVERQTDRTVQDFAYRVQMQGLNIDDYLKMQGMEMESFRKLFTEQSEKQVRTRLALEEVAKAEKLEVSEEDLDKEFATIAEMYKMDVEEVKKAIPADGLKTDLVVGKAVEFVRDNAKAIKPKKVKKEETAEDAE